MMMYSLREVNCEVLIEEVYTDYVILLGVPHKNNLAQNLYP